MPNADVVVGTLLAVSGFAQLIFAGTLGELNLKAIRWQLRMVEGVLAREPVRKWWSRIAGVFFVALGLYLCFHRGDG